MNTELLTIDDLCHELGIGKNTAYKLIKSKKIKSAKIGRRLLIRRKDFTAYIDQMIDNTV
jgi:excisionase family DNA binding protein